MLVLAVFIVYLFVRLMDVIMLLYLSFIVALFLSIFVDFFNKRLKVPRVVGVIVALLVIIGMITALVALVLPTFLYQGEQLLSNLPKYLSDLETHTRALALKYSVLDPMFGPGKALEPTNLLDKINVGISGLFQKGMGLFVSGVGGLIGIIAMLMIAVYIVIKPTEHYEGMLKLCPKSRREKARKLLERIGNTIRHWMVGRALAMLLIMVISTIGFFIAGVKFALFLGILNGILCFIPLIGPLLGLIGPVLVSLIDSPIKVIWVLIIFIIVQITETYFFTPLVMKKQVDLPPVITIAAVIGMGSLLGLLGLILAIPTVAIAMIILKETYLKKMEEV